MKLWKILTPIAVCLALVLLLLPATANAAIVASGTCGEDMTWMLNDEGTLTIEGFLEGMDDFTNGGSPWYAYRSSIKKIVIDCYAWCSIGDNAFAGCTELTSLTITGWCDSNIGENAFSGCDSLTDVYFGWTPEQWAEIIAEKGSGNEALTKANVHYICGDNVTWAVDETGTLTISGTGPMWDYGWWYAPDGAPWCENYSVKKVVIGDDVTSIGEYAFNGFDSLKTVEWGKNVSTIGECAFAESGVETVVIPDTVTEIGLGAFYYCCALKTATLGAGVTELGAYVFESCLSLQDVTLGKNVKTVDPLAFYGANVQNIYIQPENTALTSVDGILFDATGKTLLVMPNGREGEYTVGSNVTAIGELAFVSSNFTKLTIPGNVKEIGDNAFEDSYDLTEVILEDGVPTIGKAAFCECMDLKKVWIPDSVTAISDYAFYACRSLTNVAIPETVTKIGRFAFEYCSALETLVIPKNVSEIGEGVFLGSTSLTNLTVDPENKYFCVENSTLFSKDKSVLIQPLGAVEGVYTVPNTVKTIYPYAFFECYDLTGINIPGSVEEIGRWAFHDCDGLTEVTLPSGLKTLGKAAFEECDKLTTVTIPGSVTSVGIAAFGCCDKLERILVDAKNPVYCSDDSGVVYSKDKTVLVCAPGAISGSYEIPEGVHTVSDYAFNECWNLKAVTFSDGVTKIGEYAFADCEDLNTVTIPVSMKEIGEGAFTGCYNLYDVYYGGTEAAWNKITVGENNNNLLNAREMHFADAAPGDVDGNSELTTDDAVYLLLNFMFGAEDYPVSDGTNLDYNGDGKTDTNDAVYLLLHIMFGEEDYPLPA